jgi:hypothetical protein
VGGGGGVALTGAETGAGGGAGATAEAGAGAGAGATAGAGAGATRVRLIDGATTAATVRDPLVAGVGRGAMIRVGADPGSEACNRLAGDHVGGAGFVDAAGVCGRPLCRGGAIGENPRNPRISLGRSGTAEPPNARPANPSRSHTKSPAAATHTRTTRITRT